MRLTGSDIPEPDRPVTAAGRQQPTIRAERHSMRLVGVTNERARCMGDTSERSNQTPWNLIPPAASSEALQSSQDRGVRLRVDEPVRLGGQLPR